MSKGVQNLKLGGVPIAYLFFLIALFTFSSYKLQYPYHLLYRTFLLCSLLTIIQVKIFGKILLTRYLLWLYISVFVLGLYWLAGHGDEKGFESLKIFIYAIPFFLMGLRIGISDAKVCFQVFVGLILIILAGFALKDILIIGKSAFLGLDRSLLAYYISKGDEAAFIMHYPTLSAATLLSCGLYEIKSNFVKVLVIGCQSILVYNIIVSTWTGATLLIIFGISGILLFIQKEIRLNLTRAVFITFMAIVALVVVFNLVGMATHGRGKVQAKRISNIIEGVLNPHEIMDVLDDNSGGRISLAKGSISSFVGSPIIGVGPRYHVTGSTGGGHSFVFDTFAYYGLLGGVPIMTMILMWINAGIYNCLHRRNSWSNIAATVVMISTFIGCFYNPYLLHSRLDYLFFFAGGFICGQRYTSTHKKQIKQTGKTVNRRRWARAAFSPTPGEDHAGIR